MARRKSKSSFRSSISGCVNLGIDSTGRQIPHSILRHTQAECWVHGVVALTLRVSRVVGVAPLKFRRHDNGWLVSTSPWLCVYSCLLIAAIDAMIIGAAVLSGLKWEQQRSNNIPRTSISNITWFVDLTIVMLIANFGVFTGATRMNKMIIYMNRINMILFKLNKDPFHRPPDKKRCVIFLVYLLGVTTLFVTELWSFLRNSNTIFHFIVQFMYNMYFMEAWIMLMLEMQYVYIAFDVHLALKEVNESLNSLLYTKGMNINDKSSYQLAETAIDASLNIPTKSINIIIDSISSEKMHYIDHADKSLRTGTVHQLMLYYTTVCDVVRQVNDSSDILLLLLLFSFLVHLVVTPYNFIMNMFNSTEKNLNIVKQLWWCLYHFSKMVILVEPGHRMQYEIDKTKVLVSQLLGSSARNDMSEDLEQFFKQITLNQVCYSPLGMCILARPLVTTILGVVSTYLVIIVQFQFY